MNSENLHIAVDYGSKMAGTTVICFAEDGRLHLMQSTKGKDADAFIMNFTHSHDRLAIYLDAPLSLPSAYTGDGDGDDYFFRSCDRHVNAMSPMFLGGLIARAIRLRDMLQAMGHSVMETYPAHLAKEILRLTDTYTKSSKKSIPPFLQSFQELLPLELSDIPDNWHQVDAILAWYSGYRHLNGLHLEVGDPSEGIIIV